VKLLRSEVSPFGEVLLGKLYFTWHSQTSLALANFTFAKQKLHPAENYRKNYQTSDVNYFLWDKMRLNAVSNRI